MLEALRRRWLLQQWLCERLHAVCLMTAAAAAGVAQVAVLLQRWVRMQPGWQSTMQHSRCCPAGCWQQHARCRMLLQWYLHSVVQSSLLLLLLWAVLMLQPSCLLQMPRHQMQRPLRHRQQQLWALLFVDWGPPSS